MRILAIAEVEEAWLNDFFNPDRLEGVDLIVSCGDLSVAYLERVVTRTNLSLAFVRGNHDLDFDEQMSIRRKDVLHSRGSYV